MRRLTALLMAGLGSTACVENYPESQALPPVEQVALVAPHSGESPLSADVQVEGSIARGHVEWAATCRRAVLLVPRKRVVEIRKPNRPAGVAAGMGAIGAGTASGVLYSHLNDYSDERTCTTDDAGEESCSSPRGNATGGVVLLAGAAIALAAASLVTLSTSSTRAEGEVKEGPPGPPRIVESGVACGEGPVAELGIALYRGGERVAVSTTNADGDIAWSLPRGLRGEVTLVADDVPADFRVVTRGSSLGRLQIPLDRF
ncbi:MAG TPA: hypothetical protein VGQ57_19320 [Polyangiaceae bacterium]|jgi:hypothetical protein|nr:hypothetical protein [Polyangiaceae bacterium]